MCPAELGQVLHIPDVVVVVTGLFTTDYGVVQQRSDPFRHAFIFEFHPAFRKIELLVTAEATPTFANQGVLKDRQNLTYTVRF